MKKIKRVAGFEGLEVYQANANLQVHWQAKLQKDALDY